MRRLIKKRVPLGIKIISILYYVGAGISALTALALFVVGIGLAIDSNFINSEQNLPGLIEASTSYLLVIVLVIGVLLALIAVLEFFIAKKLVEARKWTRVLIIIFAAVSILSGFFSLAEREMFSLVNIVFGVLVGGYLLTNKEVKAFFS